jgi:hypothetical protein
MYSIPAISDVLVAYATIEGKNTTNNFFMGDCFSVTVALPISIAHLRAVYLLVSYL